MTQRHTTARMCFAGLFGRLGLRGAAARRSATCPSGLVGLRGTSHTRGTLCAIFMAASRRKRPLENGS